MSHKPASRMSAFFWNTGEPSIFAGDRSFAAQGESGASLQEKATARQLREKGLHDPMTMQRKGGISISPRDTAAWAKTTKIMKAGI